MSTITHELRTPLGFLKGYTMTTLLRPDTKWDQDNRNESLTIIDQETDTLQELIDNILDTARLQSGTMPITLQQVRIGTILRDVIKRIETQHPDSHILFQYTVAPRPSEGDPRRLAQVFSKFNHTCNQVCSRCMHYNSSTSKETGYHRRGKRRWARYPGRRPSTYL